MCLAGDFQRLVSGAHKGLGASVARAALAGLELPYGAAMQLRNWRFDRGWGVCQASVPVVSVGNLTLGGTGKTPFVGWLAAEFQSRGLTPALVSRGYGARTGPNDEALELAARLPGLTHIQNPDRVAGAQRAVREHEASVVLLDDGFQHRRLHRDRDIVLVDGLEPFGYGRVFPRGTLREPLSSAEKARTSRR